MSLLAEIQESLLTEGSSIGPILLKLRFLANRLGSDVLEDWVRHETEGYPKDADVPDYRKVGIFYTGTFQSIANVLSNIPVPNQAIHEHAGKQWTTYEIRESIPVIDNMLRKAEKGALYAVNTGNLQFILQDKLMEHHTLIRLDGRFSVNAFYAIQETVRAKVLDLTLRLDREVPDARAIVISTKPEDVAKTDTEKAGQLAHITVYGQMNYFDRTQSTGPISIEVKQGDINSFIGSLVQHGIPEADAKELADIITTEPPESPTEPLGKRAKEWLADKFRRGVGDAWKTGQAAVITEVVKQAAKGWLGMP